MEKLDHYRQAIRNVLQYHADLMNGQAVPGEIVSIVSDEKHDEYLLVRYGFPHGVRTHYVKAHLRLFEGKVWVEYDMTHKSLAEDLEDEGVPREDIMIAFNPVAMTYAELAA